MPDEVEGTLRASSSNGSLQSVLSAFTLFFEPEAVKLEIDDDEEEGIEEELSTVRRSTPI